MSFPAIYLLIPHFLFAGLAVMVFFFNIFHIAKFGLQSTRTAFVLGLYTLGFFAVAIISVVLISQYSWSGEIELTDAFTPGAGNTISL